MAETTMPSSPPARERAAEQRKGLWVLWLSALAGPVVYSVYFLIGYMVAEAACKADLLRFMLWGVDGLAATEALLTVITVLILAGGTVIGLRTWRRTADRQSEENAACFLAFAALFLNPLFFLTTLATGGALLFVEPCRWL